MLHTSLKAVDDSKSRVKRHAIHITCMSFQALNKDPSKTWNLRR